MPVDGTNFDLCKPERHRAIHYPMSISLHTDTGKAKEQLDTLDEFMTSLPSGGMYFRHPEIVDIDADFGSSLFREKERAIREAWKGRQESIETAIAEVLREHGVSEATDIRCYLVALGPYGYYNAPDEVFVNIWDAAVESVLETIVHESLHLALTGKTASLSYEDAERLIDSQFKKGLLFEIFPGYVVQVF